MTLSYRYRERSSYALCGVLAEHANGGRIRYLELTAQVRLALTRAAIKSKDKAKQASGNAMSYLPWEPLANVAACSHLNATLSREEVSVALQAIDGDASE